ncbi:MAG: 50S ribosomal protein L30 [Myxococcota bacterium]
MESKTYMRVQQVKSVIGRPQSQRMIVRGLGLRKTGHCLFLPDTPATRGMVEKVQHLLQVSVHAGSLPSSAKEGGSSS